MHRASPVGWHAEFMRQQKAPAMQQRVESMASQFQNGYMFNQSAPYMMDGGFDQMNVPSGNQTYHDQQPQDDAFDEAAFQSAFDQASADIETQSMEKEVQEDPMMDKQQLFKQGTLSPTSCQSDIFSELTCSVMYIRHALQKTFWIQDNIQPMEERLQGSANWFTWLEEFGPLPAGVIRQTKIDEVLRLILNLESIPGEEVYNFKTRAQKLRESYKQTLANQVAPSVSNVAPEVEEMQRIGADTIPAKE